MQPGNLQRLRDMRAIIEAFQLECENREHTDTEEAHRIFEGLVETLTDIIQEERRP